MSREILSSYCGYLSFSRCYLVVSVYTGVHCRVFVVTDLEDACVICLFLSCF